MSNRRKIRLSAVLCACQFFIYIVLCSAGAAASQTEVPAEQQTEDLQEQDLPQKEKQEETKQTKIKVTELDLGDYEPAMTVGEKQLLTVTALPVNADVQTITYHSGDEKVAAINGMGRITAKSVGTTEISVSCGKITEKFVLTVTEAETEKAVSVTDIELADYEEELEVDKTMNLSATVLPSEAADTKVTFVSDNTGIAAVSSSGEVKGIAPGQVTITMQAGEFQKSITLTVKIATVAIELNSTYVILKCGETFRLSGTVKPQGAKQTLTFQSLDTSVAEISGDGVITAKTEGNTTVLVSNGDMSNAVTVIVNLGGDVEGEAEQGVQIAAKKEKEKGEELMGLFGDDGWIEIDAEAYEKIEQPTLKKLYTDKKGIRILGSGYIMELYGADIVNYENELFTALEQKEVEQGKQFIVNQGQNLPGKLTVYLKEAGKYKYIYLYNAATEKYERIKQKNFGEFSLNTSGTYLLTAEKLGSPVRMWYIFAGFAVLFLVISGVYVIAKKKYWFW